MSDENTILQMAAFEKAMVEGGYFHPQRSHCNSDSYLYERDHDRFSGWMLHWKMNTTANEQEINNET